jgi:hypothetical protein
MDPNEYFMAWADKVLDKARPYVDKDLHKAMSLLLAARELAGDPLFGSVVADRLNENINSVGGLRGSPVHFSFVAEHVTVRCRPDAFCWLCGGVRSEGKYAIINTARRLYEGKNTVVYARRDIQLPTCSSCGKLSRKLPWIWVCSLLCGVAAGYWGFSRFAQLLIFRQAPSSELSGPASLVIGTTVGLLVGAIAAGLATRRIKKGAGQEHSTNDYHAVAEATAQWFHKQAWLKYGSDDGFRTVVNIAEPRSVDPGATGQQLSAFNDQDLCWFCGKVRSDPDAVAEAVLKPPPEVKKAIAPMKLDRTIRMPRCRCCYFGTRQIKLDARAETYPRVKELLDSGWKMRNW